MKTFGGKNEKSENIKYEETEEFQVKKLNLIINTTSVGFDIWINKNKNFNICHHFPIICRKI